MPRLVYLVMKLACYNALLVCMYPPVSVYEKIMERMQEMGATVTGLKKVLADWAKRKGLQGNQNVLKK